LGLFVSPDLLLGSSFLSTRAKEPNSNDWKKLGKLFRFSRATQHLKLTLEADGIQVVKWFIDVSFAVHGNMRSHTGAMMMLGKGCMYASSARQRLNTKSSTEAELVGVSDVLPQVVWTRNFLRCQGYKVLILLEKNGRGSSSKRTHHINICYFFVTDRVQMGEVGIEYCPTKEMIVDFFTK